LLRKIAPTAVLTQLDYPNLLGGTAAVLAQVPRVLLSFRNYNPSHFPYLATDWFQPLYQALAESHRIMLTGNSNAGNADYASWIGIDESRIACVPNAIDVTNGVTLTEVDRQRKRRELGISSRQYLLSVGSLEPRKNLRALLTAWRRIAPELPDDIDLVVVGAKGASQVFSDAKLGEIPPRVCLTGYVAQEQLPALYSGAMALIYPSLYEGFGLPPLEAMACGTPVVTSGTTSLPEVVGDSAVLVDPLSPDSIAEGIQRIVLDGTLRDQLRESGLLRARGITWERAVTETRKVFASVL